MGGVSGGGGEWPDAFRQMQGLTSLTVCKPLNSGPVPSVLFTLTNLTHLTLRDSGFTFLSESVTQPENLQELDMTNVKLTKLPLVLMSKMHKLTSVDCSGVKIASPPAEIAKQGPTAVARYILDLEDGVDENTDVLLMFIGDGEAGKTSTLLAVKNTESNTARPIGVDDRTIGIDISEFTPYPDAPLRFSAWDFGGQAVYAIMQQLFMSRRALYSLLWRVRESLDISHFDPAIKCDVCKKRLVAPKDAPQLQQPIYRIKG
jgi:internalin A